MGNETKTKIAGCEGPTRMNSFDNSDEGRKLAIQCRDEMEKETEKPYFIVCWPGGGEPNYVAPFCDVRSLGNCKDGAVFDSYFIPVEPLAKQCAEVLSRMTKTKYEVIRTHRFLVNDIYTVKKSK